MNLVTDVDVILSGLLIVFAGMIAIVGLVYAVSFVVGRFASDEEKTAAKAKRDAEKAALKAKKEAERAEKIARAEAEKATAKASASAVVSADNMTDDELIAVISAAVAAYLGNGADGRAPRFKVTAFKRVNRA